MRYTYRDLFIKCLQDIKNNPVLLVPDLVFIITTIISTSIFLYLNGLLKGIHLDYENLMGFVTAIFNSTPSLLRLIISFVIITSIQIFLGITTITTKYNLCKRITQNKDPDIIQSFLDGKNNIFDVFGIKFIISLIYFVPLLIYTLLNVDSEITGLILSLIVFVIWILLKIVFFYVYPTLMLDTRNGVIKTIKGSYKYLKINTKQTLTLSIITMIVTASISYLLKVIGGLLIITTPTVTSIYTVLSTIIIIITGLWGLLVAFRSY